MKKRIWILIGLIFLILVIILNFTNREEGKEVETTKVSYAPLVSTVSGDGLLRAKSQVNISSQVMGKVERLYVQEGDWVKKGQLLCLLERKSYEAQYELAKARLEQARAQLIRSESLFQKNFLSQEEYERVLTEYQVAAANFKDAQDRYEKTEIHSPINGKVVKLNIEEGETVIIGTMNNPGTVLMVIADLSKMVAVIEVSERDVVDIKLGNKAEIELEALPERKFSGEVVKVGCMPVTRQLGEEKAQTFEVEIEITDTSSLLRPGMTAHAKIETNRKEKALVIPISAVGKRKIGSEEKDGVFRVEKGRAKIVPVKTGLFGETEVEIAEGLKEGELVITGPYRILAHLRDGELVKVK